jgi:hypothetical protein
MAVSMKFNAFWGLMQCSKYKFTNVSEEAFAYIFRAEAGGSSFSGNIG